MAGSDGSPVFKFLRLYYLPILKTPSLAPPPASAHFSALCNHRTPHRLRSCFPQFRLLAFVPDLYTYDGSENRSGPGHLCPPRSPPVFVLLTSAPSGSRALASPREGLYGCTPAPAPGSPLAGVPSPSVHGPQPSPRSAPSFVSSPGLPSVSRLGHLRLSHLLLTFCPLPAPSAGCTLGLPAGLVVAGRWGGPPPCSGLLI